MNDLELKQLDSFIGTFNYYNVMGIVVTDGVKYIMDNGYSWFVTDAIAVIICPPPKLREYLRINSFLVVKLSNLKNNQCDMIMEDGNDNILYKQHYKFTDAKRELTLFYSNGVLMLASEY